MSSSYPGCCGITRRGFLLGAGTGLAGAGFGYWGYHHLLERLQQQQQSHARAAPRGWAMPGPFPGRVVEVNHPGAVTDDHQIQRLPVKAMMDRGMCQLTGADHATEAWRAFFEPGDIVGVKVNPVGQKNNGKIGSISSHEVVLEIVAGLKSAGVPAKNIILFERYAKAFREAGYEKLLDERSMQGVRWFASAADYTQTQVDIEGYDGKKDRDAHVAGYDPDQFVHMGFASTHHDPKDDRRFRSHLSMIVSRMVNKIVTIPVLKDHRSAGVTLALKNMSHGFNSNVARSHLPSLYHGGISGGDRLKTSPNQCNTFIPAAVNQPLIRRKVVLHVMDGLIGVYEGGPGSWNKTWATWRRKSLFFATDPVAMDHVGWDIIDHYRSRKGWQPVGMMGTQAYQAMLQSSGGALSMPHVPNTEQFNLRQPEHVLLAGQIGLGVFDATNIDRRLHRWQPTGECWTST